MAPVVAAALGAEMIERHVTLDPKRPGPDNWFSLPIADFSDFAAMIREAQFILGDGRKVISPSEDLGRRLGTRSVTSARDLRAGDVIGPDCVKVVRPGTGLAPDLLAAISGMAVTVDVPVNTPLTWNMFKP